MSSGLVLNTRHSPGGERSETKKRIRLNCQGPWMSWWFNPSACHLHVLKSSHSSRTTLSFYIQISKDSNFCSVLCGKLTIAVLFLGFSSKCLWSFKEWAVESGAPSSLHHLLLPFLLVVTDWFSCGSCPLSTLLHSLILLFSQSSCGSWETFFF